jgi:hypothetical protein
VTCTECSSSSVRLSRFRWSDMERLALLQYPVRCRNCGLAPSSAWPRRWCLPGAEGAAGEAGSELDDVRGQSRTSKP